MNEPRLDSVCNSNIHSAEGSLVLGGDIEEGELPSSPEPDSKDDEVFSKNQEEEVEQQHRSLSSKGSKSGTPGKVMPLSGAGYKCDESPDKRSSYSKTVSYTHLTLPTTPYV